MIILRLLSLSFVLLLTGCASQYSISENEIEQYLNKEMHFGIKQGNSLIGIQLTLNEMEVELGEKPNIMAVTALTRVTINNPLLPVSALLKTTFEAKPWYNSETKSIYLKNLDLVSMSSEPIDIEQVMKSITPQLMTFLRGYLENQPVYTLDTRDSNQAMMAKMTKEIEVKKGKLVIKF